MPKATQEDVSEHSDGGGLAKCERGCLSLKEFWRRMFIRFVIRIRGCSEAKCYHLLKTCNLGNQVLLFLDGFFPSLSVFSFIFLMLFIFYLFKKWSGERQV